MAVTSAQNTHGGKAHGSINNPRDFGSAGGSHAPRPLSNSNPAGGLGGGYILMRVGESLTIDGKLNVDGAPGASTYGGSGGSGGSISIFARWVFVVITAVKDNSASWKNCTINRRTHFDLVS